MNKNKKLYQCYENSDTNELTLADVENIKDLKSKGFITIYDRFLYEIVADTFEEAMSIHYLRQGFGPYNPVGNPERCPTCGYCYYSLGSGECFCGYKN